MIVLILSLFFLGLFALLAGALRYRNLKKKMERGEIEKMPEVITNGDSECCGQHEVCEKESLLAAVSREIEYYEDEELDLYRGTHAEDYTEEDVEAFRNVFYTLQSEEVAGWVRSLQLREVELPTMLKDEVFLIIGERRER
ncbi:MAG: phospholipase [Bacteroidaceae bacterium]